MKQIVDRVYGYRNSVEELLALADKDSDRGMKLSLPDNRLAFLEYCCYHGNWKATLIPLRLRWLNPLDHK